MENAGVIIGSFTQSIMAQNAIQEGLSLEES
jgi:hypothetical protein